MSQLPPITPQARFRTRPGPVYIPQTAPYTKGELTRGALRAIVGEGLVLFWVGVAALVWIGA